MYASLRVVRWFSLICFLFVLAANPAMGREISLVDHGAVVNDGSDDGPAFRSAFQTLLAEKGGVLLLPDGLLNLNSEAELIAPATALINVSVRGQSNTRIQFATGGWALRFANLNHFEMTEVTFIGNGQNNPNESGFYDVGVGVFVSYVQNAEFRRVSFFGIAATNHLLRSSWSMLNLENCQFSGNHAADSAVYMENMLGFRAARIQFVDYSNFHGATNSKTPVFTPIWLKAFSNRSWEQRFVVTDSTFDEGATVGIDIEGVSNVEFRGLVFNLNFSDHAKGVFLRNVDFAEIAHSWFGWATISRPAVYAKDCKFVELKGLRKGAAIDEIWRTSNTNMTTTAMTGWRTLVVDQ